MYLLPEICRLFAFGGEGSLTAMPPEPLKHRHSGQNYQQSIERIRPVAAKRVVEQSRVPHLSRSLRKVGFHDPKPLGILASWDVANNLISWNFPQASLVTSDLAPHFKFVHHCPGKGSKKQFFEN
jgi:hypothetical protein